MRLDQDSDLDAAAVRLEDSLGEIETDGWDAVVQQNTGGLVVAAVPGIAWNVAGPMWLLAQVQVPFATSLYGVQSVGVTGLASLQFVLE